MSGPAITSVSNNRPSVIRCKAVNSVTVTEIPVQLEPMYILQSKTPRFACAARGNYRREQPGIHFLLSAILALMISVRTLHRVGREGMWPHVSLV